MENIQWKHYTAINKNPQKWQIIKLKQIWIHKNKIEYKYLKT